MILRSSTLCATAAALLLLSYRAPGQEGNAEKLMRDSDCSSCHAADRQVVGPAYNQIAKQYASQAEAAEKLAAKIRSGGGGMTPHPNFSDAQLKEIVAWVLSRKESAPAGGGESKTFSYTLKDGTTVQLDFPMFGAAGGQKVTREVFHGYQLYNSYCYRCHGTDATGGQLAPDLRRTVAVGMKQPEFMSVAMIGRKDKGMPEWAGFLSEDDVIHIFRYVKGRSLELVPVGRPPSERD